MCSAMTASRRCCSVVSSMAPLVRDRTLREPCMAAADDAGDLGTAPGRWTSGRCDAGSEWPTPGRVGPGCRLTGAVVAVGGLGAWPGRPRSVSEGPRPGGSHEAGARVVRSGDDRDGAWWLSPRY